jgi:hypothetical protein
MFELAWRGGATEARLHRRRPAGDALPWGTLAPDDEARAVWSNGCFTEYASAAAFSTLTGALLECGAPVDLVAMAADIVVDEMFHVELSARLTMELGGAVPIDFDLAMIAPVTELVRPIARAAELAVVTSCVSESLSVPAIARSRVLADAPLARGVLDILLADEGPHARLGFWFLDWAAEKLSDDEREALGRIAGDAIDVYAPLWQAAPCTKCSEDEQGRRDLEAAVETNIARPLSRYGICVYRKGA